MSKPHTITKFKEMPREAVYEQGKDIFSVLHNIVVDIREEADQNMINDWGISPKQLKSCNVKVHGVGDGKPALEMRVTELKGGYIGQNENSCELAAQAEQAVKLLNKFEKEVRKKFKERVGKALSLSKGKVDVDYRLVALNGLYQFTAMKVCEVKNKVPNQEWERSS